MRPLYCLKCWQGIRGFLYSASTSQARASCDGGILVLCSGRASTSPSFQETSGLSRRRTRRSRLRYPESVAGQTPGLEDSPPSRRPWTWRATRKKSTAMPSPTNLYASHHSLLHLWHSLKLHNSAMFSVIVLLDRWSFSPFCKSQDEHTNDP